jgi:hypothetical protein
VPPLPGLLSPSGLLVWFLWNALVLASIQLTVRLIRAFSLAQTLLGAAALTLGSVPIALWYVFVAERSLSAYPAAMLLTALLGYLVACFILSIRRQRGRVVAAVGTGLLAGPWPVLMPGFGG